MADYVYSLKFAAKSFPVLGSTVKCNDGTQIQETVKIHGCKFAYKNHSGISDQTHNRICGPAERAWDAVSDIETPHGQLYAEMNEKNQFTDGAEVKIYRSHYGSTTDAAMDRWEDVNRDGNTGNHVVGRICKKNNKWVFIPNNKIDFITENACNLKYYRMPTSALWSDGAFCKVQPTDDELLGHLRFCANPNGSGPAEIAWDAANNNQQAESAACCGSKPDNACDQVHDDVEALAWI
jgi:hypothetical protein